MKCDIKFVTKPLIGMTVNLCDEMESVCTKYVRDDSYARMLKQDIFQNELVDFNRNLLATYSSNK